MSAIGSTDLQRPGRATTGKRSNELLLLQIFVWFATILPSRLIIGPLGAFGSPAALVGLGAFGLWASSAARPGVLARTVFPVRAGVVILWIPGLIAYAVMQLHSMPGDEINSADRWLLFMLVWSGVALLAAEGLRDRTEVLRLVRVLVAGVASAAAIALVQNRIGFDVTQWMTHIPGLSVNGDLQSVLERQGRRRAAGTATHPLELGTVLAMALGPATVLAVHDLGWSRRRRVGATSLIALAIPISISRSAIISSTIVGAVWFAVADRRSRLRGVGAVVTFAVVIFMTSPGLIGALRTIFASVGTDTSVSTRTDDYAAVAPFIRRSPWVGRGPGTFLPKYRILDNQWLLTLIETGVLGAIALALYFLLPAYLGVRARRRNTDDLSRGLGQAFLGLSLVAVWSATTFDFFSFPMTPAVFALSVGIAGALSVVGAGTAVFTPQESAATSPVESEAAENQIWARHRA